MFLKSSAFSSFGNNVPHVDSSSPLQPYRPPARQHVRAPCSVRSSSAWSSSLESCGSTAFLPIAQSQSTSTAAVVIAAIACHTLLHRDEPGAAMTITAMNAICCERVGGRIAMPRKGSCVERPFGVSPPYAFGGARSRHSFRERCVPLQRASRLAVYFLSTQSIRGQPVRFPAPSVSFRAKRRLIARRLFSRTPERLLTMRISGTVKFFNGAKGF